jgi:hypothetical protein
MKKYLKITNKGEIEAEALTLLGASTKTEDQIGYFGTGNKYALSTLLRNKVEIKLFSGENEISVTTKRKEFRDKSFDVIVINDIETGITTNTGKDWELWHAIREIYSNALDEGDVTVEIVDSVSYTKGYTSIHIEFTDPIQKIYYNFDKYFALNRESIIEVENLKIYRKLSNKGIIYRRGIRAYHSIYSLYDYDIKNIRINEMRLINDLSSIAECVWKGIVRSDDINFIRSFILELSKTSTMETDTDNCLEHIMYSWFNIEGSESLQKVLNDLIICPISLSGYIKKDKHLVTFLPTSVFNAFNTRYEVNLPEELAKGSNKFKTITEKEVSVEAKEKVKLALEFLRYCGYNISYPIKYAEFDRSDILGAAYQGTIYLAADFVETNDKQLIMEVLIEENIHLKYDVYDETREMQTKILKDFVETISTMVEESAI